MFILYDHVFSAIKAVGGGLSVQKSEDLGPHLSRRATGHREPLLPIDKTGMIVFITHRLRAAASLMSLCSKRKSMGTALRFCDN